MLRKIILIAALLTPTTVLSQVTTPKAVITCQSSAKIGQLVRVTAIKSENVKSYKWAIIPDTQEIDVSQDNKSFIFTSEKSTKYTIFLAVASPDGGVDFTTACVIIDTAAEPPQIDTPKTLPKPNTPPLPPEETLVDVKDRTKLADILNQGVELIKSGNLDTKEDLLDSLETFAKSEDVKVGNFFKNLREVVKNKSMAEIKDLLLSLQKDLEK